MTFCEVINLVGLETTSDSITSHADKKSARMTYKGFRGYMSMVGHLAQNGLVVVRHAGQIYLNPKSAIGFDRPPVGAFAGPFLPSAAAGKFKQRPDAAYPAHKPDRRGPIAGFRVIYANICTLIFNYTIPARKELMEDIYSLVYTVRNYELGPYQAAHVRTLLDYLGETADSHIRELGVSIQDLLEKDLLWVLAGYRLKVSRYPRAGEKVTVNTWYPGRQERFYLRDFEVLSVDGEPIAAATTSWALIDALKRRPVTSDDALPYLPVLDRRAIEAGIEHIPPADSPHRGYPFTVPSSCLDMYRHVNHVFYIQWALDSVLPGIESGILPSSIEAVFKGEAVAGDQLVVALQSIEEEGTWLHSITREKDGKEITRLRTRWGKDN